ncbi:MAG TPA: hypothetical protein VGV35_17875 [Bryobacteraceae bacterium]|nr:hypothetical protein [Bryobacteraceae bacterium]
MIRRRMWPAAGCVLVLLSFTACRQRPKSDRVDVKTALLPEASAEEKNFSSYQPAKPYAAAGNNVLGRTVFQADAPAGYRVEVRDWKVAPGKQTDSTTLPGAAFIEVRSGAGTLSSGPNKQDLPLGAIASISQDQAFTIANTGTGPLSLRVYLVLTP